MPADLGEALEITDLVDPEVLGRPGPRLRGRLPGALACALVAVPLRFGGSGRQQAEVGVVALREPSAGEAVAAGLATGARRLAQQRLRQLCSECRLADASRAVDQQRVVKAFALAEQPLPRGFQPVINHVFQSLTISCSSITRIAEIDWPPSSTTNRPGSPCARSR